MKDILTVIHQDGTRHENVRASVSPEVIVTNDATIPISVGDTIERQLPSRQIEELIVTDVHFQRGGRTIRDFYEIHYERQGSRRSQRQPSSVNVNVRGSPNTRVNLHSTDQSINIVNSQASATFEQIRDLLEDSVTDRDALEILLEKVNDMERSRGTSDFLRAYKDFVASAADHITVLSPVLPMLTAMLETH